MGQRGDDVERQRTLPSLSEGEQQKKENGKAACVSTSGKSESSG